MRVSKAQEAKGVKLSGPRSDEGCRLEMQRYRGQLWPGGEHYSLRDRTDGGGEQRENVYAQKLILMFPVKGQSL